MERYELLEVIFRIISTLLSSRRIVSNSTWGLISAGCGSDWRSVILPELARGFRTIYRQRRDEEAGECRGDCRDC